MRAITIVIIECDLVQSKVQRIIWTGQILTLGLKQCYLFRCQRWKQNVRREDLLHKSPEEMKHFRICGEHFLQSHFIDPNAEWVHYLSNNIHVNLLPVIIHLASQINIFILQCKCIEVNEIAYKDRGTSCACLYMSYWNGEGERERGKGREHERRREKCWKRNNIWHECWKSARLNATMEMQPYRLQIWNSISGHQTTTCYYYAIKVYHYPFSDWDAAVEELRANRFARKIGFMNRNFICNYNMWLP